MGEMDVSRFHIDVMLSSSIFSEQYLRSACSSSRLRLLTKTNNSHSNCWLESSARLSFPSFRSFLCGSRDLEEGKGMMIRHRICWTTLSHPLVVNWSCRESQGCLRCIWYYGGTHVEPFRRYSPEWQLLLWPMLRTSIFEKKWATVSVKMKGYTSNQWKRRWNEK